MKVERDLKVTADEFYTTMVEAIRDQINSQFGKDLTVEDIKEGYTHKTKATHKDGSTRTTRFKITRAIPGREFTTVHISPDTKSRTSYELTPTDKGVHVIYTQEIEFLDEAKKPGGFRKGINDFLQGGKLSRGLTGVESEILKKRKQQKNGKA